jgi:GNAT superfamily N-acetyltransferase
MPPEMPQHPLDNPTWHALTGPLAHLAIGEGPARRFRPDVAVFAAIADESPESWHALAALSAGREAILNRRGELHLPEDWTFMGGGSGFQMMLDGPASRPEIDAQIRPLDEADVDAMTALVQLTEPGPWRPRTITLGGYVGIEVDGRLLAMAGQRLDLDGYTEISAVCTHPDARRRGYAAAVTAAVASGIQAVGKVPILHVAAHNPGAKRVYEQMGFVTRTSLMFSFVKPPQPATLQPPSDQPTHADR